MKRPEGRIFYFLLSTFYFLLSTSGSAQVKVLPETAKLIPSETVLLVNVSSFSQLEVQFRKTNFYRLYKDPAMTAFMEACKNKLREKIRKGNNEIVNTVFDSAVLPQGRVAFGLVLNKQAVDSKEPTAFFIIQWGQNCSKIKEAVDKQVKKAVEGGAHQRSENYRDVDIKTIIAADSPRLGHGFSSKLNYCFVDDCLIGSEDIEILKFIVAHIKGASGSALADDADYTATKPAIGPYHDVDFYVSIKQVIKMTVAEDNTGKTKTKIGNLGFDNVTSFGLSIGLNRLPGSSFSAKAFLKIDGMKKGICRMLDVESGILNPPQFVPASACSTAFFNLDIKKAYDELGNILSSFSPQAAAVMFMPILPPGPQGEPGLEMKRDIIDYLGSQILSSTTINKPFSASSTQAESIVALAVNNRKALEKSLSLLHSKMIAANNPDTKRELLGHTIYLVSLPGLRFPRPGVTPLQAPDASTAPQMLTLAFSVTDTHLIFGTESIVERAIRALGSTEAASLGSAKWFTSVKSAVPSVVGLANLQDNAAASELSWWMMKKSTETKSDSDGSSISLGIGMISGLGLMFSQTGLDLFNYSLLPEFDTVRKYFGLSAFYGVSRPDGFFFEFKYLNPRGTD